MIYDCILYDGEKELLEIRLNETKLFNQDVMTIIIMAEQTHTGTSKPTYAEHAKYLSSCFDIFAHIVDLKGNTPREREAHQRNQIKTALEIVQPKDSDIILIGDVDEIPRARAINLFPIQLNFASLLMDKYAYFLNNIESEQSWDRARIMTWEYLKDKEPEVVRNSGYDFSLHHAGWHWSWVIDPLRKLQSFSHTELDIPENIERIERRENVWNDDEFRVIDINLSHPEHLYRNQEKYKHLIKCDTTTA